MASILVDDTDPQVQYLPVANWTPFRIAAEDILSFPSNGLISPMYGTLHLANNGESNSAANTSVGFNYIGTKDACLIISTSRFTIYIFVVGYA